MLFKIKATISERISTHYEPFSKGINKIYEIESNDLREAEKIAEKKAYKFGTKNNYRNPHVDIFSLELVGYEPTIIETRLLHMNQSPILLKPINKDNIKDNIILADKIILPFVGGGCENSGVGNWLWPTKIYSSTSFYKYGWELDKIDFLTNEEIDLLKFPKKFTKYYLPNFLKEDGSIKVLVRNKKYNYIDMIKYYSKRDHFDYNIDKEIICEYYISERHMYEIDDFDILSNDEIDELFKNR